MNIKNILLTALILLLFWLLLVNDFTLTSLILGMAVALFLSVVLCKSCGVFSDVKLTPASFYYTFVYLGIFLLELIQSNLDVARRVISPSLPIKPGIVEVKTRLTSPMARLILANSITLTPGTLTVDLTGDKLYIHWIEVRAEDRQAATEYIVRKFEKYLEKIYD
jgi:multicomponent Na+:H+ antiporter subunit E